jgi:hypothetical protein
MEKDFWKRIFTDIERIGGLESGNWFKLQGFDFKNLTLTKILEGNCWNLNKNLHIITS